MGRLTPERSLCASTPRAGQQSLALISEVGSGDYGPRTFLEYVDLIWRRAGTRSGYHTKWLTETQLDRCSPEVVAHEIGTDIVEMGSTMDVLNALNLEAFQLLGRKM